MDAFLKEMEINWFKRKMMTAVGGVVKMQHFITQTGDDIICDATGPRGKAREEFTVGVEKEMEMQPSGIPAKFIAQWNDGMLDCQVTPIDPTKKSQRLTRELQNEGKEMLVTCYMGDVVCKRFFKK